MDKIVVPKSILNEAEMILGEVQASASHQMNPISRRQLYRAFANASDISVRIAPRWLAVLASQRVLPLFNQKYPDDLSPREFLDLAIAVLQGKITKEVVEEKLDLAHDASSSAWCHDEREIPWPAWLAADSTYHALMEAHGYQPLDHLPPFYKNDVLTDWTDDKLCEFLGDTAAVAAMSFAYDERGLSINADRLLEFWEWWLKEAIMECIFAAQHGYLPTSGAV